MLTIYLCVYCFYEVCRHCYLVVERTMYERKVDVDMLNDVKSVLADVSSVSPSSEQARNVSQHTLYGVQHIHINLTLIHCTFYRYTDTDQS